MIKITSLLFLKLQQALENDHAKSETLDDKVQSLSLTVICKRLRLGVWSYGSGNTVKKRNERKETVVTVKRKRRSCLQKEMVKKINTEKEVLDCDSS